MSPPPHLTLPRPEILPRPEAAPAAPPGADGAEEGRRALRRCLAEYKGRIAVVSSFGAESAVLLALAADIDPSVPVLFLETGQHAPETLAYRRRLAAVLGLRDVRDPKGLYAAARAGRLSGFTGVDAPYEPPIAPDLVISTATATVGSSAERLAAFVTEAVALPGLMPRTGGD